MVQRAYLGDNIQLFFLQQGWGQKPVPEPILLAQLDIAIKSSCVPVRAVALHGLVRPHGGA